MRLTLNFSAISKSYLSELIQMIASKFQSIVNSIDFILEGVVDQIW